MIDEEKEFEEWTLTKDWFHYPTVREGWLKCARRKNLLIEQMSERIKELEAEIANLRKTVASETQSANVLSEKLQEAENELSSRNVTLQSLRATVGRLEGDLARQTQLTDGWIFQTAKARERIEELETELAQLRGKIVGRAEEEERK